MSRARSVVQAHHEEMAAIFEVLKTARRVANGEAIVGLLRQDLDDLDTTREEHRALLAPRADEGTK